MSTALWDLKDILNSQQNRSQNKLVHKNAVSRVHGVFMDQFILFSRFRLWAAEMLNSTHYRNTVETDNMTFFSPSKFDRSHRFSVLSPSKARAVRLESFSFYDELELNYKS